MKKTIYLHVGLHKTGTTTIQKFLFDNTTALEKLGLYYPLFNRSGTLLKMRYDEKIINMRSFFCNNFDFTQGHVPCFLKESVETRATYEERFQTLFLEKIEQSSAQNIIFSEEFMSTLILTTPIFIDALLKFNFNVKILVYIRPPADWIVSVWSQNIKASAVLSGLSEYVYRTYDFIDLNNIFRYINILGKENVIIKPYERMQWKNSDLIDDFFDTFSIDIPAGWKCDKKSNVSPGRNTTELCRILTCSGAIKFLKASESRKKLLEMVINEPKTIETLTDGEILDIVERTRPLYTKLANIYGKESFFINEFPSCYGKERATYDTITLNPAQLEIFLEVLSKNRQEKDERIMQLEKENERLLQQVTAITNC